MPNVLGYLDASTQRADRATVGGCLFAGAAALSAVMLALWANSYRGNAPVVAPNGEASAPPPGPHLALPLPSDAAQCWIPLRGRLERWEYTGWDRKWYRWRSGMILPLWVPATSFAILPLAWARRRWRRSGDDAAP